MARAGYDPRDMANMFKTIEQQGGSGGPQWLSDHPNPGNRYAYINKEAQSLHVENARHDNAASRASQAHLRADVAGADDRSRRRKPQWRRQRGPAGRRRTADHAAASSRPRRSFTTYNEGNVFRVSVPSNWRELPAATTP